MDPAVAEYARALAITVGVEVPLITALAAVQGPTTRDGAGRLDVRRLGYVALVSLGANLATHGLLWATFSSLPGSYHQRLLACETAVWLVEAGVYAGFGVFRPAPALAASLVANAMTTLIGLYL